MILGTALQIAISELQRDPRMPELETADATLAVSAPQQQVVNRLLHVAGRLESELRAISVHYLILKLGQGGIDVALMAGRAAIQQQTQEIIAQDEQLADQRALKKPQETSLALRSQLAGQQQESAKLRNEKLEVDATRLRAILDQHQIQLQDQAHALLGGRHELRELRELRDAAEEVRRAREAEEARLRVLQAHSERDV